MDQLVEQLRQYFTGRRLPGVGAVYLFGSRARGAPHAESDVDIALVIDPAAVPKPTARARLAEQVGGEMISVLHTNAVDVVCLNDVPAELALSILRDGRRAYCSDAELDHAVTRTALLRHADLAPFLARTRRLKLQALVS